MTAAAGDWLAFELGLAYLDRHQNIELEMAIENPPFIVRVGLALAVIALYVAVAAIPVGLSLIAILVVAVGLFKGLLASIAAFQTVGWAILCVTAAAAAIGVGFGVRTVIREKII